MLLASVQAGDKANMGTATPTFMLENESAKIIKRDFYLSERVAKFEIKIAQTKAVEISFASGPALNPFMTVTAPPNVFRNSTIKVFTNKAGAWKLCYLVPTRLFGLRGYHIIPNIIYAKHFLIQIETQPNIEPVESYIEALDPVEDLALEHPLALFIYQFVIQLNMLPPNKMGHRRTFTGYDMLMSRNMKRERLMDVLRARGKLLEPLEQKRVHLFQQESEEALFGE